MECKDLIYGSEDTEIGSLLSNSLSFCKLALVLWVKREFTKKNQAKRLFYFEFYFIITDSIHRKDYKYDYYVS